MDGYSNDEVIHSPGNLVVFLANAFKVQPVWREPVGRFFAVQPECLRRVVIQPVEGEPVDFSSSDNLQSKYDSAHSCMYRTCDGRMR